VITGASSGIGLVTAESAARQGAKVVLAASSQMALGEIVARIRSEGGDAIAITCDVRFIAPVKRLVWWIDRMEPVVVKSTSNLLAREELTLLVNFKPKPRRIITQCDMTVHSFLGESLLLNSCITLVFMHVQTLYL
jgi:enoyl-[acyl-carrier-protein] reductase (NADH)